MASSKHQCVACNISFSYKSKLNAHLKRKRHISLAARLKSERCPVTFHDIVSRLPSTSSQYTRNDDTEPEIMDDNIDSNDILESGSQTDSDDSDFGDTCTDLVLSGT